MTKFWSRVFAIKSRHSQAQDLLKQGRIHSRTVADGWAGAVMQKPLRNVTDGWTDGRVDRRTDGPTDGPTRQGVESSVRD